MTGLMHAVYLALKTLPCGVSRAWPQAAQGLPAAAFSLLDWQGGSQGPARAQVRVSLRAVLPEEADELAGHAANALEPLGLRLANAKDDAEADTGVFLKNLAFEGTLWDGLPGKLRFSLLDAGAWVPLEGLVSAAFTPGERPIRDTRPLSAEGPVYTPGEISPETLHLTAGANPLDPGQRLLSQAFQAGTPVSWRLMGGAVTQEGTGLIKTLSDNALAFAASLIITP